jgi:hypothetical protein
MSLLKEATYDRDGWRDMELPRLADLALMTGLNVPFDIVPKHRPPEAQLETSTHGKDTLVSQVIVSLFYQIVPLPLWRD